MQVDRGRRHADRAGDGTQRQRRGGWILEQTAGRLDDVIPETLALTARVPGPTCSFVLGYSPLAAGVRTLPSAAALAIFSPLGARVARRFGTRIPVVIGLATMTAGLGLFATAGASSSYAHYVTAMVILCAGMGLAMAPATESVMRGLPPALAGIGSAVNDATRNLGSVLGVAVIGSARGLGHRLREKSPARAQAVTSPGRRPASLPRR
jgi:MFS family permease